MKIILEYFVPIISLTAGIIAIVTLFKSKNKYAVLLTITSLVLSTAVIIIWNNQQKKKYDLELLTEQQNFETQKREYEQDLIVKDAKSISKYIIITGYEDYGDYIAYLATMVGFYKRHNSLYEQEYLTLNRQLTEWQDDLREMRKKGSVSSYDYDGLIGLVKSTKDRLDNIGE